RTLLPRIWRSGPAARGADAIGHRAHRWPDRGEHLRRRVPGTADVLLPPGAGLGAVPHTAARLLPVRLGHASGRLRNGRSRPACRRPDPEGPICTGARSRLMFSGAVAAAVAISKRAGSREYAPAMPRTEVLRTTAADAGVVGTLTLLETAPDARGRYPAALLLSSWRPRTRDGDWDRVAHAAW